MANYAGEAGDGRRWFMEVTPRFNLTRNYDRIFVYITYQLF